MEGPSEPLRLFRLPWGFALFILVAITLSIKILGLPFLYDDIELWAYNGTIADFSQIMGAFVPKGGNVLLANVFYRPLTHLTWWFDGMLWGDWVPGYRLTNLLIHLGGAIVCGRLVLHFTENIRTAWFTGLVFVLHAAHLETLGWTSARGDLLAVFFMALGLLGYIRCQGERCKGAAAAGCFLAALLSKETALIFPVWIVATDLLLLGRLRVRSAWISWAVLAGLALVYLAMRFGYFGGLAGYDKPGESIHLDLLKSGLLWQRLDTIFHAILLPWPGQAEDAGRYIAIYWLMAALVVLALLIGSARMGWRQGGFTFLWFLVIAVFSYLPGSVIEIGYFLENSRMVYGSSLAAVLWLGLSFKYVAALLPRLWLPIAYLFLACWTLVFGLALQSWDDVGDIRRKLPAEVLATYGRLAREDEVLFFNEDLDQHEGLRLFSTTASAFGHSLYPAFGIRHTPKADWQHPESKYRFEPDYWFAERDRLGVHLFYAEWDPQRQIVYDRTPKIIDAVRAFAAEPSDIEHEEWGAAELHAHLVDKGGITVDEDGDQFAVTCLQNDCWLAFKTPDWKFLTAEITWRADADPGTPLMAAFFWVTNRRPQWGDNQAILQATQPADPIVSRFKVPYTTEEWADKHACVPAFRFDPGWRPGKAVIEKIAFTIRHYPETPAPPP